LPQTNRSFWAAKIAKNVERDEAARDALRKAGWHPVVVWGCQTSSAAKLTDLGHRLVREIGSLGPDTV
jgi:DNA mismatch endonuclease (patch repair protein)